MNTPCPIEIILPNKLGQRQFWGQLYSTAGSLALYTAATTYDGLVVAITPDALFANKLRHELKFFAKENSSLPILIFPDWEILPYDHFSPHQDIISQRLLTLSQLPTLKKGIIIVAVNTFLHFTTSRHYIESLTFMLKKGEKLDSIDFRRRLERNGYRHVSTVMEHGEFSVRGALIDVFPMGSTQPFRLDLFDNEIDSIRTFEPDSQRSVSVVNEMNLLPAKEFPLTENAISQFRQMWRSKFQGNPMLSPLYESTIKGHYALGIEYYLPLFFPQTHTLFDYLAENSLIVQLGDIEERAHQFWQEVSHRYDQLSHDIHYPILKPKDILLSVNELFSRIKNFSRVILLENEVKPASYATNYPTQPPLQFKVDSKAAQPLSALKLYLENTMNRVLFCVETLGRRETILRLLEDIQIKPTLMQGWETFLHSDSKIGIVVATLNEGMTLDQAKITLITEAQLFGQQVMQRRLRTRKGLDPEKIIRNLTELKIGDPVVHINHGVGKYLGLQIIKTGEMEAEYLMLEYADGDKLYVPTGSLHLIARYTGRNDEQAPLYQLGTKKWDRIKQKTAEKVRDVAAELLDIYSRREAKVGHAFSKPNHYYVTFCTEFPFEETPDQLKAIDEVIHDMTQPSPMDRLVCGDVGFGKTEVAMRAAFLATQDNQQVALLVPTTLLTQQHEQNFKDRFVNWPIKIASLSRFQSKKEQEQICAEIKEGKIDILIGTHKLLQATIQFKSLGLLIIDEEHRFGVHQKEKIKSIKSDIDILALTATPIPRTLNLSLTGVRDLSIIATPPAKRLSIRTFIREYDEPIIREAILREILRGGQVYFLHNDIRSIEHMCEKITQLVPEAKVNFAHGQMTERSLEKIIADFYHNRFNVLVASTIIESGIDIPTANTIIINQANHFGLAQLHQLRGRVGRSHHQAYAYLLTSPVHTINKDALKRLEAIESLEDLGAGFMLATYDLEIRGAGEILGEDQSGFIQEVGFYFYTQMLDRAVAALKEGKVAQVENFNTECEIDLKITALIPENYLPDVHTRLVFYKRIANAKEFSTLDDLQVEMIDRFGLLPIASKNLFAIAELKLIAQPLGIDKIDMGPTSAKFEFNSDPHINLPALLHLIEKQPGLYQLEGSRALKIKLTQSTVEAKIKLTKQLLKILTP